MIDYKLLEYGVNYDAYPALLHFVGEANRSKEDTFRMSDAWLEECKELCKSTFKFVDASGREHQDNLMQYSQASNGDLVCKFSQYLPRDTAEVNRLKYIFQKPAKPERKKPMQVGDKDPLTAKPEQVPPIVKSQRILKSDTAKQLVYCVVRTEGMSADQIETQAHEYLIKSRRIGEINNSASIVESFVTPVDGFEYGGTTVSKGSWIIGVEINDPDTWDKIQSGDMTSLPLKHPLPS
jgi:hypothetical protein